MKLARTPAPEVALGGETYVVRLVELETTGGVVRTVLMRSVADAVAPYDKLQLLLDADATDPSAAGAALAAGIEPRAKGRVAVRSAVFWRKERRVEIIPGERRGGWGETSGCGRAASPHGCRFSAATRRR